MVTDWLADDGLDGSILWKELNLRIRISKDCDVVKHHSRESKKRYYNVRFNRLHIIPYHTESNLSPPPLRFPSGHM